MLDEEAQSWMHLKMLISAAGIAASFSMLSPRPAEARDRDPEPVKKKPIELPEEIRGAPIDVTVAFQINKQGGVDDVSILRIVPSTENDAKVRKAVRKSLFHWFFSPATCFEQPCQAALQMTLRIEPKNHRETGPVTGAGGGPSAGRPPEGRPGEGQPVAQNQDRSQGKAARPDHEDVVAAISAEAEHYLDPIDRSTVTTKHFAVVTDVPEERTANIIGSNLEAAYTATYKVLESGLTAVPSASRVVVYVFRSRDAFTSFIRKRGAPDTAEGVFTSGLISFHLEHQSGWVAESVLLHEGVHAFLHRFITHPSVELPLWLDEGLATYVAYSDIVDGKIVPGAHRTRRITVGSGSVKNPVRESIDTFKKAVRRGEALDLERLFSLRDEEFHGKNESLHYAQSWMVVHFLCHGDPTWANGAFPRFVIAVGEGRPDVEALHEIYGLDLTSLEKKFRDYVEKL